MNNEWTQLTVIHCPNKNCKGMLLSHDGCYELLCSDCGKYFMQKIEYIEVNKPKGW